MSCAIKEVSKGYIMSNPGTVLTIVPIDTQKEFSVVTVFNEADQNIKVSYKNKNGEAADFIIPKNGRSFTRVINGGLLNNSLQLQSIGAAATGNVIFNVGN